MAMQTAVMPSCPPVLQVQQRQAISSSVGGDAVFQWGTVGAMECRGQKRGRVSSGSALQGLRLGSAARPARIGFSSKRGGGVARAEQLESGVTTTTPPALTTELNVGGITEVDKDTFWPIVKDAGEKVVVLDMYTQWCGPCKLMLPKVTALAGQLDDVIFLKLDCNKYNKVLAKELGIRVVPTFKIFKRNELAGEVSGAKYPDLVTAIEAARKS